jgi:hypothetical protein
VDADDGFLAVFVVNTDCEVASKSSPAPGTDATELERELLRLLTAFTPVGADEITLAVFTWAPRDELLDELLLLGKLFFIVIQKQSHTDSYTPPYVTFT